MDHNDRSAKRTPTGALARYALYGGILLAGAWLAAPTVHADFERSFTLAGDSLELIDLIGEVEVVGYPGDDFQVTVTVRGDDADEERIDFDLEQGGAARLHIRYPLDEERDYVYPRMGRGSRTTFSYDSFLGRSSGLLRELLGRGERIRIAGSGSGLEVWADVRLQVPAGKPATVRIAVGEIHARDVAADLLLDTASGPISAVQVEGNLTADTGSGAVDVARVRGMVSVDTGSGAVDVEDCRGEEVRVDTGSGRVEVSDVDCERLDIDTGSGSVRARAIATDSARLDTGSGSITLELERMGAGRFELDAGSGSITLVLPADASARVRADTGSGGIDLNVRDARQKRLRSDRADFTLGDGDARVSLDTGTGGIRIRQR